MNLSRFGFFTVLAALASRLFGQTRTDPDQIRYSPGPALQGINASGNSTQVGLGPTLVFTNQSGVTILDVSPNISSARPDTQQLTLEPDNLSWKVPVPITKPQIYRNGLRMLLTKDYTLESGASGAQVVRPTPSQKMKITDDWYAC
jgi:hypothetical protein